MAECLHTRLLQVGQVEPGAAAATRRREMALAMEKKGRRERAAHWLLHTCGHRVLRRGAVHGRVLKCYPKSQL